ncbi:hypothetical protein WJX74_009532 [Apatococcus lobatus]|uniref:2Fe-2S ferredoxin n=1 Tax=Apatococcus lobatus TaxID=904363 RepID=A0AAW1Q9R2_9CHLO
MLRAALGLSRASKLRTAAAAADLRLSNLIQISKHTSSASKSAETIAVTFQDDKDSSVKTVQVPIGESLLEAAHANDIDLEGACEGSLACSTCHVIVKDQEYFDRMGEITDDENDMLDLAYGLTETSRLGCQIIAKEDLNGLHVSIPNVMQWLL